MEKIIERKVSLIGIVDQFLSEKARVFRTRVNSGTSYNIGGNFYQAVSGNFRVRHDFVSYHYNIPTAWPVALEVGNNIKGEDSLDLVRVLYREMLDHLKQSGAVIEEGQDRTTASAFLSEEKVFLRWEYASSFCWIAARPFK
jgi:hypothetical protein